MNLPEPAMHTNTVYPRASYSPDMSTQQNTINTVPLRIYRIFCGMWRRRYVIALPILILPLAGLLISLSSPRVYKAHTSMLIQETAKMNPFLEDLAVSSMLKERYEALNTLLKSRHILSSVAIKLNLITEDSSAEARDYAIAKLAAGIDMRIVGKDLIRIDLTANKPERMQEILSIVSEEFIEQLLAPERSSMTDSSTFLENQLTLRRLELDVAEQSIIEFKSKHAGSLPELHSMNMARLNQLKQKLSERETLYSGAANNVEGLNKLLSQTNPVVGKIEEQIIKVRSDLALYRSRYTDKHSDVQALLRTLRRLEYERNNTLNNAEQIVSTEQLWDMASAISQNADNTTQPILISQLQNLQNAKNNADGLAEEIRHLKKMIDDIENGLDYFSQHENEFIRLDRDLRVKRDLYDELLKRHEMAAVTGSLGRFEQAKRVKIIDQPFTPHAPANLPTLLYVIAGFFAGIFFGTGLALALEMTDTTIRHREVLESISGVPVLCRIPLITT